MSGELSTTELIADLHQQYILTGFPSFSEASMALAAERDRADRAEARLVAVSATVEKFAARKYDAQVQLHGDPEYWRGAEHAQDYIVHRVRTALGDAEATA